MFGLGVPELLVILGIALVIFGPSKLPQIGSGLGKAIRDFKKGVSDEEETVKDEKKESPKDLPLSALPELTGMIAPAIFRSGPGKCHCYEDAANVPEGIALKIT